MPRNLRRSETECGASTWHIAPLVWICPEAMAVNHMAKELYLHLAKLALGMIQCKRWQLLLARMRVSTVNHVLLELDRRLTHHPSDTPHPPSHLEFFTGALEMPKSNLLKAYLPKGVIKVGSDLDSSDRGICQNPLLASNLLKTACCP